METLVLFTFFAVSIVADEACSTVRDNLLYFAFVPDFACLSYVQFIMFQFTLSCASPLGPTSTLAVEWLNEDVDMAVSLPWNKQPAPRRNSVVQTKLSGLWQASASSLGKNELAFGAVSVNLPHLSAEISKSVKSSKSTFVRGFAHGSTHNGIRLESTEKRKATLLGTLEDGVQYAETFKAACRRKYGNMTRAWRILLDPGGNGRVSFVPFCNAARSMGFVNVSTQLGSNVASDGMVGADLGRMLIKVGGCFLECREC